MRFMGLADQLIKRGHSIKFITSSFTPHNNSHRFNSDTEIILNKNYCLKILYSKGYKNKISFERFLAHYDFAKKLKIEIEANDLPDLVYISLPPIDTVYNIIKFCKKNHIPIIVDIIDPWPEVFLRIFPNSMRKFGRILFTPFYLQVKYIFNNASAIVSISKKYRNWALKLIKKNKPNGVFYPAVKLKNQNNLKKHNDKIRFVYAGALSTSYDVETIIHAAKKLTKKFQNKCEFYIAGSGPKFENLKKLSKKLNNVFFTGYLNEKELNKLLLSSDIGIACYSKKSTQSVTYKLFDYLSAGLPIISSLPGEMEKFLSQNNIGYFFRPENQEDLFKIFMKILKNPNTIRPLKKKAFEIAKKHGDSSVVYKNLSIFIEDVMNS
tara:strand:+ start:11947 stop:13086 length:1140 start_codon:yes stop_codon:yes gene_type:complete